MNKKHLEIGMWGLDNEAAADEDFKLIAQAGITHVFMNGKTSFTDVQHKILTLCERYGLKVYIFSHGMTDTLQVMHDDPAILLQYPAFDGLIAYDEPTVYKLDDVCALIQGFQARYGDKTAFVNLYPSYVNLNFPENRKAVGAESYEEYVDVCCRKILPITRGRKILSVDHYPLCVDPDTKINYLRADWLSDLEVGRKYADKYGAELHFCLQTSACGTCHREPFAEADFRIQFYTCFAFGVNGVSYFTYESPITVEFSYEQVGLIDRERKPTVRYGFAQTMKREIGAFEEEMLSAKHTGAKVYVGSENRYDLKAFEKLRYCLDGFQRVAQVQCSQNAVMGEYDAGGKYAYVLVNYTEPSDNCYNRLSVRFASPASGTLYRKGVPQAFETECLQLELEPGEGVYFSVNK